MNNPIIFQFKPWPNRETLKWLQANTHTSATVPVKQTGITDRLHIPRNTKQKNSNNKNTKALLFNIKSNSPILTAPKTHTQVASDSVALRWNGHQQRVCHISPNLADGNREMGQKPPCPPIHKLRCRCLYHSSGCDLHLQASSGNKSQLTEGEWGFCLPSFAVIHTATYEREKAIYPFTYIMFAKSRCSNHQTFAWCYSLVLDTLQWLYRVYNWYQSESGCFADWGQDLAWSVM